LNLLNQKNRPHEKIVGRFFHWTAKFAVHGGVARSLASLAVT
jgi:hypothetical protein